MCGEPLHSGADAAMEAQATMETAKGASIDPEEVARFSAIAAEWWDPKGKFAPLHRFNPVRLGFIRETALARFGRDPTAKRPFEGLRLLDIGCGGGLLSEPMTRLGFSVTGVDASPRNIATARTHAAEQGLEIDYRAGTAEALAERGERFDIVLNMEVVEHVAEPGAYLRDTAQLVAPGGVMIVATLNRTLKALALAKIGAEYVLRWLPPGMHDWKKFLTPEEVRSFLSGDPGLRLRGPFGVAFDPLRGSFKLSSDVGVNYMMLAERDR
jgi:2-polyprenyl-6-hydroxyphenyl methylase/3-demethylubiquinone-9 3-methyltransferase